MGEWHPWHGVSESVRIMMDGMESGDPVRVTDTKSLWSCRPKWRAVKEGKASRKEPGERSTISTAMDMYLDPSRGREPTTARSKR